MLIKKILVGSICFALLACAGQRNVVESTANSALSDEEVKRVVTLEKLRIPNST